MSHHTTTKLKTSFTSRMQMTPTKTVFHKFAVAYAKGGAQNDTSGSHQLRGKTATTAINRGGIGNRGKGTSGYGGQGTSPTEEITFDLFGAKDFNDAVTSGCGYSTEKVHVTSKC